MSEVNEEFGYKGGYGLELVADFHDCDLSDLSKEKLHQFMVELCNLIKMKRHGDPIFWEDYSGIPHLHGISAVQFIETSTIVCHPIPMKKALYLNVFSCKEFDIGDTLEFCKKFWKANDAIHTVVPRT